MRPGAIRRAPEGERTWAHICPFESPQEISEIKFIHRQERSGRSWCRIPPPVRGTHGGLLRWHVGTDLRTWSCWKPRLSNRGRRWATARFDTTCQGTVTPPVRHPPSTCTPTCPIRGCLCGCRCTAPGSDRPSPAPTSKDACTTFWKGRPAGSASCITSLCECFHFHNHPDPWGIKGYNCNSKILIKQGVNCACRALERSLQRTANPVNFRQMQHRYHRTTGCPSTSITGTFESSHSRL